MLTVNYKIFLNTEYCKDNERQLLYSECLLLE